MSKLPDILSTPDGYEVPVPVWLRGREMPYPRTATSSSEETNTEVIAGSMRVGKSTAAELLVAQYEKMGTPAVLYAEEWWNNPYLKDGYLASDPSESLLLSQLWFLDHKYKQTVAREEEKKVVVQDASVEMYYGYALTNAILGRMRQEHFEKYQATFEALDWTAAHLPHVLLYLDISDNNLVARARKSAREFEVIDESYFLTMSAVNLLWLEGLKAEVPVVHFDTNVYDYSSEESAQNLLFSLISEKGIHV